MGTDRWQSRDGLIFYVSFSTPQPPAPSSRIDEVKVGPAVTGEAAFTASVPACSLTDTRPSSVGETSGMALDRDVEAFDRRASEYERGWRGRLHRQIADEVGGLALEAAPHARSVLDVGCGTGYLLRWLAERVPTAQILCGVDAAKRMIEAAEAETADRRVSFVVGVAEELPYEDGTFDLVVSTTSFDHWRDQRRGLAECARVLESGGCLVLADLLSPWLLPTLYGSRRRKARTKERLASLLTDIGITSPNWHPLSTPLISAVTAMKP